MPDKHTDEFYIGYLPKAPKRLGKTMRGVVIFLIAMAAILAVIVVLNQQQFYPSVFEFGNYRTFEGIVKEKPYPTLLVPRPGEAGGLPGYSQYYLVAFGKFGAQKTVNGMEGKRVKLEGSLIYRDNQTMIEIADNTLQVLDDKPEPLTQFTWNGAGKTLGTFQMEGEIVDSKCYLGVMNPGNLKPHKSCAVRCISGGIPPVLVVKDHEGLATYFLLVSEDGKTVNREVLPLVADPVQITGEVIRYENLLVLKANPNTYRKLN